MRSRSSPDARPVRSPMRPTARKIFSPVMLFFEEIEPGGGTASRTRSAACACDRTNELPSWLARTSASPQASTLTARTLLPADKTALPSSPGRSVASITRREGLQLPQDTSSIGDGRTLPGAAIAQQPAIQGKPDDTWPALLPELEQ